MVYHFFVVEVFVLWSYSEDTTQSSHCVESLSCWHLVVLPRFFCYIVGNHFPLKGYSPCYGSQLLRTPLKMKINCTLNGG